MSSVSSILPVPGVEYLRCGTSASGYRNVYKHGTDANGNVRYVAKVKWGSRLVTLPDGRSSLPHISAAAVLRWYQSRFGSSWKEALRRRKCNPVKVWYSKRWRGWLAAVWLWGQREEVRPTSKRGWVSKGEQPMVFWSREDAVKACFDYAKRRYGLFYLVAMFRA